MALRCLLTLLFLVSACAEGNRAAAGNPDGPFEGCRSSSDCDDGDPCTADACDLSGLGCTHLVICCSSAADCDDGVRCTDDFCEQRVCKHPLHAGCCGSDSDCDDANACTMDTCDTGSHTCTNRLLPNCCTADSQCDDADMCTTDTCDLATHACRHQTNAGCCNSSADCNDGNACTTDTCNTSNHVCTNAPIPGCCASNADCNDQNQCTTDTCDLASHTCTHVPNAGCCNADTDCNDGNACTADICGVLHQCVHNLLPGCCSTAAQCDDGNVCTIDACNTATNQCTHTGVASCCTTNAQCDDHSVCSGIETCVAGTCMPGTPLACNDNDACTTDSCDPIAGCQHAAVNCNDGNACTTDTCTPATGCQHTPLNCDDGDVCTTDSCDAAAGCVHAAIPNCAAPPNDLCAGAIDITNTQVVTGSTLGAHHEVDPSCVDTRGRGGADVFYQFTLTDTEVVYLDTFASDFDTAVYLLAGCGGAELAGGCNDDSGCGAPDNTRSQLAVQLNAGTYIVVVDAYAYGLSDNRWMGGAFMLHFNHSGPNCGSATHLVSGVRTQSDTCTGVSLQAPGSCGSADIVGSGKEHTYYLLECPGTHAFSATTCDATTSALDSVVYVKAGDCNAGDIGCNDDAVSACAATTNTRTSALSTTLPGGGIYYVMVDTYGSSTCGPYGLRVTF